MLKQRIITALILAPLALFAILYLPLFSFQIVIALVVGLGAWEWSSMSGMTRTFSKAAYTILVSLTCVSFSIILPADSIWHQGQLNSLYTYILCVASIWWVVSLGMIIAYPKYSSLWYNSKVLRGIFGFLTLIPTWVAVVTLRTSLFDVEPFYGASLIFYVLGIVWAADVGAFFVGVKFGKHRIMPTVSPKKSWEGSAGGLLMVFATAGLLAIQIEQSFTVWHWLGFGLVVAVSGTVGDFFESYLKRKAGVKDSGIMLPGHGGFLDRFDSTLFAVPCSVVYLHLVHII